MLLSKFKELLGQLHASDDSDDSVSLRQLASAALLLEVSRADFDASESERLSVHQHLQQAFGLSEAAIVALTDEADKRVDESTSLYEFTRIINDECGPAERVALIEQMWRVAYADGELCRYEEHLIRRVAELIYVSHGDFIRTKHAAAHTG